MSQLLGKSDQGRLKELIRDVDIKQDKFLYGEVARAKTKESVESYLKHGPLKTMAKQVEAWQTYLQYRDGERPYPKLTLKLASIDWRGVWNRRGNAVTVSCNGAQKIYEKVESTNNASSDNIGEAVLENVVLTDSLNIKINILLSGYIFGGQCEAEWRGRPNELHNHTVTLSGDGANRVTFMIIGLPSPPELPDWKE